MANTILNFHFDYLITSLRWSFFYINLINSQRTQELAATYDRFLFVFLLRYFKNVVFFMVWWNVIISFQRRRHRFVHWTCQWKTAPGRPGGTNNLVHCRRPICSAEKRRQVFLWSWWTGGKSDSRAAGRGKKIFNGTASVRQQWCESNAASCFPDSEWRQPGLFVCLPFLADHPGHLAHPDSTV